MNKFLNKYKEERHAGTEEYKAFGIAVSFIAAQDGTLDDLNVVYDYFMEDSIEESEREFERLSKYRETSYQRGMRLSGMRERDFIE